MNYFQESLLLYLAAFVVILNIPSGEQTAWLRTSPLKREAVQELIAPRIMDMGESSTSKGKKNNMKENCGNMDRKFNRVANSLTLTSSAQQRRRSGRLANLYWKDLSGISSETDPIILDSDPSEDEVEEGKRSRLKSKEGVSQNDEENDDDRQRNMKDKTQAGEKVVEQAPSKGKKAAYGGQIVDD